MSGDIERRIRERAYEIWESEGRPENRSDDHWKQARAEFQEASAETEGAFGARSAAEASAVGSPKRSSPAANAATKSRTSGRTAAAKAAVPPRRKKPGA